MVRLSDITLCLIGKNEEDNLRVCLESASPYFDRILYVDTGSEDDTIHVAEGFGAKVAQFEWVDDFSKARNVWHEHVKSGWIFWLDCDDTISEATGRGVHALEQASDICAYSFGYVYNNGYVVDHYRMYRADRGIYWTQSIHEYLNFETCHGMRIAPSGLAVTHAGFDAYCPIMQAQKAARNNRLLEKELQRKPDSPLILYYLGASALGQGNPKKARSLLKRCIRMTRPESDQTWAPEAYVYYAKALNALGDAAKARNVLRDGYRIYPRGMPVFVERHLNLIPAGQA